jgi:hypothetical protein
MKIRIRGNSLRYRLTRTEVEQFAKTGFVQEKINIGGCYLSYALKSTVHKQLSAEYYDNKIILFVPESMVGPWANSDQTGFEHYMDLEGSEEKLFLLVEKDFTCLDKVDEDQSDNYPNPLLNKVYEQ